MTTAFLSMDHGLGDSVQFGVVLKHLRKYQPDWQVTVRARHGTHSALYGLCHRVLSNHDPEPPHSEFDKVFDLPWYENHNQYADCPNTKVTNCLREIFHIEPDKELLTYSVQVRSAVREVMQAYLESCGCEKRGERYNAVIIHYEGNTSSDRKNLDHGLVRNLCNRFSDLGYVPIILDWDNRSPIPDQRRVFCPRPGDGDVWAASGTGDAERITALIAESSLFIGIDSGPQKCAGATSTPTLAIWTRHDPMRYYDLSPNVWHIIREDFKDYDCLKQPRLLAYFQANYRYSTYQADQLYEAINKQATRILNPGEIVPEPTQDTAFVLPNGIGDVMWALHKIRSAANGKPIDIILSGKPDEEINHRAVPFLKRFPFVRSVKVHDIPVLEDRNHMTNALGRYRYVADGIRGRFHYLVPNAALEAGRRLETWLPEWRMDWSVIDELSFANTDRGNEEADRFEPFVAFYLGPERGNVDEGHNWGFQWEPKDWVELGKAITRKGLEIVLVGAEYDRSYWERYVRPGVRENGMNWEDRIGSFEIGETFALLKRAEFFISYQCGLGIVAHYLGIPVAMWWRADGSSISPHYKLCFDERMAHSWTNPKYADRYIPLIYKRETPADIVRELDKRGWW